MAANATWAIESSAINHQACFEIEDTKSSKIAHDDSEIRGALPRIVGNSAALRRVLEMVRIVAPTDATVFDPGGNRNWEGTDCGRHSQIQRPIERPVCEGELRRNSCRFT
jgi:hypothetical protein